MPGYIPAEGGVSGVLTQFSPERSNSSGTRSVSRAGLSRQSGVFLGAPGMARSAVTGAIRLAVAVGRMTRG